VRFQPVWDELPLGEAKALEVMERRLEVAPEACFILPGVGEHLNDVGAGLAFDPERNAVAVAPKLPREPVRPEDHARTETVHQGTARQGQRLDGNGRRGFAVFGLLDGQWLDPRVKLEEGGQEGKAQGFLGMIQMCDRVIGGPCPAV
jgi:hypothetical protein